MNLIEQFIAVAAWRLMWTGDGDYLNDVDFEAMRLVARTIPNPFA